MGGHDCSAALPTADRHYPLILGLAPDLLFLDPRHVPRIHQDQVRGPHSISSVYACVDAESHLFQMMILEGSIRPILPIGRIVDWGEEHRDRIELVLSLSETTRRMNERSRGDLAGTDVKGRKWIER